MAAIKTLALRNGDLVPGPTGYQTLSGAQKIRQDLALALGESYGDDRFHPAWGSALPNYIGEPVGEELRSLTVSEAARVIQQYIDTQSAEVLQDSLAQNRSRYDTDDVVSQVLSIDAELAMDTIKVKVVLRTMAGQSITISRTVGV